LIFKGVSVTKEHLAGFDTEYVPLDFGKNRLLSAQLSISALVKMHIPV
jgi:hypothetical protein